MQAGTRTAAVKAIATIGLVVSLGLGLAPAAPAGAIEDCNDQRSPIVRRDGCTAVIGSGRLAGAGLARVYANRGRANRELGALDAAIADLDEAIRLDPSHARAWHNRGIALARKGEFRSAIRNYDRALRLAPGRPEVFVDRGDAYMAVGGVGGAIFDYGQAITRNPGYVTAYVKRGAAWASDSPHPDADRAMADFDMALRLDRRNAEAYYHRGNLLADLGHHRDAVRDYGLALNYKPDHRQAYNGRGRVYAMLGQHERALADFNKALAIDRSDLVAQENRARSFAALGQRSQAIQAWSIARQIGGTRRVLAWQNHLAEKGHYRGPFDGIYSHEVERALFACATDPDC